MALKVFRPLTPSLRFTQLNGFEEITKGNKPVRKLTEAAQGGWKLVSTYHLHHLNSIDFVFGLEK